jgi:hypothetical protein
MGEKYERLSERLIEFIEKQQLYFVGTATARSRVNISPKGMDSLRVLDEKRVIWLNLTGSSNESSAHVQENPRMTIMFAAFEGRPMILRLYGQARVVHQNDPDWSDLYSHFPPLPGARQIFDLSIELVQTSCGMAVPLFEYAEDRRQLSNWANKKGESRIREYWEAKNQLSLDGQPTHILSKTLKSTD